MVLEILVLALDGHKNVPGLNRLTGFPFPLFPSLWDSHSHSSPHYGIPSPTLPLFMGFPFPLFPWWDSHSHSSLLYGIPIPTLPFFIGFPFPLFPSLWDSHSHSTLLCIHHLHLHPVMYLHFPLWKKLKTNLIGVILDWSFYSFCVYRIFKISTIAGHSCCLKTINVIQWKQCFM
jgi:hypothetical protein